MGRKIVFIFKQSNATPNWWLVSYARLCAILCFLPVIDVIDVDIYARTKKIKQKGGLDSTTADAVKSIKIGGKITRTRER